MVLPELSGVGKMVEFGYVKVGESSGNIINYRNGNTLVDSDMRPPIEQFLNLPPPNYTDPARPSLVDVFKGKDDENFIFKTLVLSKFTALATAGCTLMDVCVGTRPTVR